MRFSYRAWRALARFCFTVLGRLEVVGQENIPPFGPLLVVSNHVSYNDPPTLAVSISRPLHFLAKEELFTNPLLAAGMRSVHVYPLGRASSGLGAMRTALGLLARDQAVAVFPEGRRSPDHSLIKALPGVAYLAIKSQATILPVGITGTEKFPAVRMPLPLCRFQANIGLPFTPPVIEGRVTRDAVNAVLDLIMQRVAMQLPEEYRGAYSLTMTTSRDRVGRQQNPEHE